MELITSYNFNIKDITDNNYKSLFEKRRRDACFACAYRKGNFVYAIRDHLGSVPLYYRFIDNKIKFSINLLELVKHNDSLNFKGVKYFLALGTTKLHSLIKEIKIVPPGSMIRMNLKTKKIKIIYRYKIKEKPFFEKNSENLVNQLDTLFFNAIRKTVKSREVGLYLSGGIDSALIGIYLKKMGIKIHGYTCVPFGMDKEEISFAKINANIIGVDKHSIVPLDTKLYKKNLVNLPKVFGTLNSSATSIGIVGLWNKSNIKNADTANCAMPTQYYTYFLSFLPKLIKKKIHWTFKYDTAWENYLSFATKGVFHNSKFLDYLNFKDVYSKIFSLTLGGMYIGHTPRDGETLSAPAIKRKILFSNPYYDMDLIEFFLRIPLKYRINLSKKSRILLTLEKNILRKLASRYLPKKIVYRKRDFIVSMNSDIYAKKFCKNLPSYFMDNLLPDDESKIAGQLLLNLKNSMKLV